MSKLPIILFGASKLGIIAMDFLKRSGNNNFIFTDNDSEKWETKIQNIDVIPPSKILNNEFEKIIITSMYSDEIANQLLEMGITKFQTFKFVIDKIDYQMDLYKRYGNDVVRLKSFYNIGSGTFYHPYWTNVDFKSSKYLNNKIDIHWDLSINGPVDIKSQTACVVYSSHTIEHITDESAQNMFNESYRILKKDGVIRITAPNIDLVYNAFKANDREFFYWIENYNDPIFRKRANINKPNEEISVHQLFLHYFASHCSTIFTSEDHIQKIDDKELKEIFNEMSYEDALNYCTGKCDKGLQTKYPHKHINWWNFNKLKKMLTNAGFKDIYLSGYGQSRVPILRDTKLFDNTYPKVSLYVEARK